MLTTLGRRHLSLISRARELPRVTYAGGQAGTGTGGVGGAGPIGIDLEGFVRTGNISGTQTLEDGSTIETTIGANGSKYIVKTDYTTGLIYTYASIQGVSESYTVSYLDGSFKSAFRTEYKENGRKEIT